jgi:DNA adenine methylase
MNTDTTESPMKMTAVAPLAGCKRNLARRLHEVFGPHNAYWAPFCGGLGDFLTKPTARIEVLNDLHRDLTNLMKVVADRKLGPILYRRLRRIPFCQQIHTEAQDQLAAATDPLERAYLYFIKVWMAWSGTAGTKRSGRKMSIRYTNNGGQQATRYHNAVASIPAWRRRMRNVTILNMDAFQLIPNIEDAPGTVVYCDPPYLVNSVDYEHDFLPLDHVRLAQLLHRFRRTRVVVSYYRHPALADLYPGWSVTEIEVTKAIAQIAKRQSLRVRATEVVLVNQPFQMALFPGAEIVSGKA